MENYAIEMLNITKKFPGIIANDNVTLQLRSGEIHALLGENGAGKSTLMSVLFGLYQAEEGVIKKNGQVVQIKDPNDANALGIGMVHQHFKLVECFSVLDNIILGVEDSRNGILQRDKAREKVMALSEKYGLEADVINLHSLSPLDYTKILESVRKTGKVILVSDACARGSYLNDVARTITEQCFDDLDAPPVVVGAKNWITPPFEFDEFFFPQASWILDAIHEKLAPLPGYEANANSCDEAEMIRRNKAGV